MGNKFAIEELYAERSSLHAMLEIIPSTDFLGRIGLESKLNDIKNKIDKLKSISENLAESFILFGGKPVCGSLGIDIDFASDILGKYQVYISAVHAARTLGEPLAEMGPIPSVETSAMQLIGTPRGSFGFALREKVEQNRLAPSSLYESVEVANELIAASIEESEDNFENEISDKPLRVIKELSGFFKSLDKYGASVKLVSARVDVDIPEGKVCSAISRTENIEIIESEELKIGTFLGARKFSRDFNFQPDDEGPLSGKLSSEVEDNTVSIMNMEFQDKRCKALLARKETRRKERGRVSVKWVLKDIYLADE